MNRPLPCLYSHYSKTRWYRRLVAGEFIIQFDQYPEREVIIDEVADKRLPIPSLIAWKDRIRELCTQDASVWNTYSPGSLLALLRRERKKFLQNSFPAWAESGFNHAIPAWNPMESTEHLLIIPDVYDAAPLDVQIQLLRSPWGEDTKIHVGLPNEFINQSELSDPILFLDAPHEISSDQIHALALKGHVVCADVWYALAFLQENVQVSACLDHREWFAASICNTSVFEAGDPRIPETSHFHPIFKQPTATGAIRMFKTLTPEQNPSCYSGVIKKLSNCAAYPSWIASKHIAIHQGFFLQHPDGTWEQVPHTQAHAVHVSLATVQSTAVTVEPKFFRGKASPLEVSYPHGGLFTSFNYYFTENLKAWYAHYDDRPLPWDDFSLDYIAVRHEDLLLESVPLYQKALLGYSQNGELFACEGDWDSLSLTTGRTQTCLHFDRQGKDAGSDATIYFPNDPDTLVGAGKICATIIHDYVWAVCEGPVKVPPFGVVVASAARLFEKESSVTWSVHWKSLPVPKETVVWLAGGFNALILDGENQVATDMDTTNRLRKEGWYTKASQLTQETQLTPEGLQPRSAIGGTSDDIFILSIAGRFPESEGATFSHVASLAQSIMSMHQAGTIEFLVNLDGGASSVLGLAKDGEKPCLLTQPSPSLSNSAGQPRRVPAFLTLQFKEDIQQ